MKELGAVLYTYNASYLEGRARRITCSSQPGQFRKNLSQNLKKKQTNVEGYNLVVEYLLSMHKALHSIHKTINKISLNERNNSEVDSESNKLYIVSIMSATKKISQKYIVQDQQDSATCL